MADTAFKYFAAAFINFRWLSMLFLKKKKEDPFKKMTLKPIRL